MPDDIINLLNEKEAAARKNMRCGAMIGPGAIGDSILMLPLAAAIKDSLALGRMDFIGNAEYIEFYPNRTCIDTVRSIESIPMHRLFESKRQFDVEDPDILVNAFESYQYIVSFMGEPEGNFHANLLYTVNCSHCGEVTMLPFGTDKNGGKHISQSHIDHFFDENTDLKPTAKFDINNAIITPLSCDRENGIKLLQSIGVGPDEKAIVICPGAGGVKKCWPVENFLKTAEMVAEKGVRVLFLLGPAEAERFDAATIKSMEAVGNLFSNCSLTQVVQFIACADLFLGNDSGITHIAGAMGVKTFAIFGATNPVFYRPIGPFVKIIDLAETPKNLGQTLLGDL
jgi:ADP-heptose:LPS heptosyltransferase